MILGRPTNLWLGFVTALTGFSSVLAITVFLLDPVAVGTVAGSAGGVLGALIALVAGQPPTVNVGDTVRITTPAGEPTAEVTAALPQ